MTTIILAGCIGLAVGSFLNVVIHRLPKMMERDWRQQCAELDGRPVADGPGYNLARPPSHCPQCQRPIRATENIPILSYVLLGGRCKGCGCRISIRYPLVEGLSGLLAVGAAWHFTAPIAAVGAIVFVWSLIALTFIDFDTQLLPDVITLPLLWLGLLMNVPGTYVDLGSAVVGAAAGYLALWSVYWLFRLATGKEGMGFGDFKLLAAIGGWLGWQMLPLVILLSSLVGAVVGIFLLYARRHGRDTPIPFGPYLAAGGVIALFWGPGITSAYLALLHP